MNNFDANYLGHNFVLSEGYVRTYTCTKCNGEVLYDDYNGIYQLYSQTGRSIFLMKVLSCDEAIIKSIIE